MQLQHDIQLCKQMLKQLRTLSGFFTLFSIVFTLILFGCGFAVYIIILLPALGSFIIRCYLEVKLLFFKIFAIVLFGFLFFNLLAIPYIFLSVQIPQFIYFFLPIDLSDEKEPFKSPQSLIFSISSSFIFMAPYTLFCWRAYQLSQIQQQLKNRRIHESNENIQLTNNTQ